MIYCLRIVKMTVFRKSEYISRGLLPILKRLMSTNIQILALEQLSQRERAVLVEKHLMSPALGGTITVS